MLTKLAHQAQLQSLQQTSDLKNMNAKLDRLEIELAQQKIEFESKFDRQQAQLDDLTNRRALQRRTTGALADTIEIMRMRFLNTYLRNTNRGKVSSEIYQQIDMGNPLAHDGAILLDKALYDEEKRTDVATFRQHYGVDLSIFTTLYERYTELQDVFNSRATIVNASSTPGMGPPDEKFLEAFRAIMREVNRLVTSSQDIDTIIYDTDSALGKARTAFDEAFKKEKHRLGIRR